MKHRVAPVREMKVWDATGTGSIYFDAAEIGETLSCLHHRKQRDAIGVYRAAASFYQRPLLMPGRDRRARPDTRSGDRDAPGRPYAACKAAGRRRRRAVARELAGIAVRRFPFEQKGIVANVVTGKPHAEIARQRFLPAGPLAFLPLPEPHLCSIVWSAESKRADELMALDDAAFLGELQQASGDLLGQIQSIGPRAVFPLALAHAVSYVSERLALVGDAAHTVHPLAGQGVNLGYLDAATLAEVLLDAAGQKKDIGALPVLRRFERWRKGENMAMLAVTGGFKQLFSNNLPGVRELRNVGLNLTNAATPIKNLIMRRASGLEGDLPRLARRAGGAS